MSSKRQQIDNSGGTEGEKDSVSSSSGSSTSSESDDEGGIIQRKVEKVSLEGLFSQNHFSLSTALL